MTNYEHFKKGIEPYSICNLDWGISGGHVCSCNGLLCTSCIFYESKGFCNHAKIPWLSEEYKESGIDWSKVPVDTKILVRAKDSDAWSHRHFAKYENGEVYAWAGGATSWTMGAVTLWPYAKLAEEGNE